MVDKSNVIDFMRRKLEPMLQELRDRELLAHCVGRALLTLTLEERLIVSVRMHRKASL